MELTSGRSFGARVIAVAVFAAIAGCSSVAGAHGGFFRAAGVLFEPGNPSHVVLRSAIWGLIDSRAGNASWQYTCADAFGARYLVTDYSPTVVTAGGRIIVANGVHGLEATDDGCSWHVLPGFGTSNLVTIVPTDSTGNGFMALTGDATSGLVKALLYATSDRGDTWTMVGAGFDGNIAPSGVAVAPSDPTRIYVAGREINGPPVVLVSSDAGTSWKLRRIAPLGVLDTGRLLPSVHPSRPDAVLIRLDAMDSFTATPDRYLASTDGGQTWVRTYTSQDDLPGLTISPDGTKVLIAGPKDGVLEAPLDDAFGGRPTPFTRIYAGSVWGLAVSEGKLYAGTDNFSTTTERSTLGVSSDGGRSFSSVMTFCDVAFPSCGAGSTEESLCREAWTSQGGFLEDFVKGPICVPDDAGSTSAPDGSGGSMNLGGGGNNARSDDGGGVAPGSAGQGGSGPSGGPDASVPLPGKDSDTDNRLRITKLACSVGVPGSAEDPSIVVAVLGAAVALVGRDRSAVRRSSRARRVPRS